MAGAEKRRPEQATSREAYGHWTHDKLRNSDTDQQGHVNHAVLATFFETGRIGLFGGGEGGAPEPGAIIMVVSLAMRFHRELGYPGSVDVGTRLERLGRTSFTVAQAIFMGADCIATAEATCVLVDERSRRPRPLSDALRQRLSAASPSGDSP
ncbi:MAG: acyl-CoA thioesterase [Alphaproteobacteria bacterium]